MRLLFWNILTLVFLPFFLLAAILPLRKRKYLVWGSDPVLANKYWAEALRESGWPTLTIMQGHFNINSKQDFDKDFQDFAPSWLPRIIRMGIGTCMGLVFVLQQGRVVHIPFSGFALSRSSFWWLESCLFRMAGIKTVILPYGADGYLYSRITDTSLRYGLLASYPELARKEVQTEKRIRHWEKYADIIIVTFMVDGLARWDVTITQTLSIDTRKWVTKKEYSKADGRNGVVNVMHTPNHRGFKGTEFLLKAVEELKAEGLQIDLLLVEKMKNEQVRELMQSADILAEQFIATAYAMSGVEGMASGLPVLANLDHEAYTRVYRRYSFLNECPILSTAPETLRDNLRLLVQNPDLREKLGRAGRGYAEKYHSYPSAQFLFTSIYDKILNNKEVDLMNLYHPLKSQYNHRVPIIDHPLVENRLPKNYFG